jgi:aryl-alcohol dehydrogenase-like predicted oxidoreductase
MVFLDRYEDHWQNLDQTLWDRPLVQYVPLTRAAFEVSRIGIGCEQLGGVDWGQYDLKETIRAVELAVERGVTLFDTANVYGLGASEQVLCQALGARRHDVVIVTKGGVRWETSPSGCRARTFIDLSRKNLRESVEGSLRRLELDAIPLYLLHWPDETIPIEEPLATLVELKGEGKIRGIGVSNFVFSDLKRANELVPIAAVEIRYNLLHRSIENDLLPYCRQQGIGVLAYGSLAEGLLTGKYAQQSVFEIADRRSRLRHFQGDAFRQNLRHVERVKQVAGVHAKTPAQVAVRWVLSNHAVSSAIVGIKNVAQLEEAVGCIGWQLEDADVRFLTSDERLQAPTC